MPNVTMEETASKMEYLETPKAPGIVLSVGSLLWKGIAAWGNVDFILSMREERLASMFQALLSWGWIVVLVVGLIWLWLAPKKKNHPDQGYWGAIGSVALVAFMFGALVVAYSSSVAPQIIYAWTGATDGCTAGLDTSKLVGFKEDYYLYLACQILDPTIDPLEDTRIAISRPFNISGGGVQIVVLYDQGNPIRKIATPNSQTKLTPFLLPKTGDINRIKKLDDVKSDKGKLLMPGEKL